MSVMIILLGVSLFVGLLFLFAFIWSVKSGQYEDDYSPAHKILFDNKPFEEEIKVKSQNSQNTKV